MGNKIHKNGLREGAAKGRGAQFWSIEFGRRSLGRLLCSTGDFFAHCCVKTAVLREKNLATLI